VTLLAVLEVLSFGCSDEGAEPSAAASSTSSTTAPASPTSTSPPLSPEEVQEQYALNDIERGIIDALGSLGIAAMRAELPSRGANMAVELPDGRTLIVAAYPPDTIPNDAEVKSARTVGGVQVQEIDAPSSPDTFSRFVCSGLVYDVNPVAPPGYATHDEFLADLIGALDCTES
jgi:hypothetical protein